MKRMVVPDLESRTIDTMIAEHRVLARDEGRVFIGWHATNQQTARALVRGGRYVPPQRTGLVFVAILVRKGILRFYVI